MDVKGPNWSVQKYFNSGKGEKKERNVQERDSGPRPEARKEEKDESKVAKGDTRVCLELRENMTHCGKLHQGDLAHESERCIRRHRRDRAV